MTIITLILCTPILGFLLYSFLKAQWSSSKSPPLPPGPRPWPIIGNLAQLGAKPHETTATMAQVYGPLVHLKMGSKNAVVAASAEVAEQFLKVHGGNFSSRPPNASAKYVAYNYQDMVFRPYGRRWRFLRKMCALHLFSAKAMHDFRHLQLKISGRNWDADTWYCTCGTKFGTCATKQQCSMIHVCTTNIIARVVLGKRVVGHESGGGDEKAEEFRAMVEELLVLAGVVNIGDFIPAVECLDLQGFAAKMKKLHHQFDAFVTAILQHHRREGHVDLLTSFKGGDDCDQGRLTDTEIKALVMNLFIAGTDTTSTTVEWAIAELIRHPKIMQRAQQELDTVVGNHRSVTDSDLPKLPFLQALVKETFRLHPPTPLSLPRIANESEVNGYFIPKGSMLLVNIWAIARDPSKWPNPLEFLPDRFLSGGESSNIDVKGNNFELIPFGVGRRICAGMNMGIQMVQLLTATLILAFSFELCDGESVDMKEAFGIVLRRANPLIVQPNLRLLPHVYQS